MSKKLLEEQSIRKFMKIAGLQPLTNTFLKESEDLQEEVGDLEEGVEELDEARPYQYSAPGSKKEKAADKASLFSSAIQVS